MHNNNTKFFTNIIYLDHEINESDLKNNIPTENKLAFSYEDDSDEYFRIYFLQTGTFYIIIIVNSNKIKIETLLASNPQVPFYFVNYLDVILCSGRIQFIIMCCF